jgi:hypothetical protein
MARLFERIRKFMFATYNIGCEHARKTALADQNNTAPIPVAMAMATAPPLPDPVY